MKNTADQKDSLTDVDGSWIMEFPRGSPSGKSIKNKSAYWRVLWVNAAVAVSFHVYYSTIILADFLTRDDSNSAVYEDFFFVLFSLSYIFPFLGPPLTFALLPDSLHLVVRAIASIASFAVLVVVARFSLLWIATELHYMLFGTF